MNVVMRYDLVAGDTQPPFGSVLSDERGPAPLASAVDVQLKMVQADGTRTITGDAVIDDTASGTVHYQWSPPDTDTPGVYRAQWHVTYANGGIETFPSDEPMFIIIHPAL